MEWKQSPRPCYDMVEEYNRSLDEYKDKVHPSDERIAAVTLEVADFMLEFSTLGHEEAADIPQFVHPRIPNEDLGSLGVPFLSVDEDGRSVLNKPLLTETKEDDKPAGVDQPPKPNEDFPDCTTYFYHRWMWIQFPWVALANCGEKYLNGISLKDQTDSLGVGRMTKQLKKKVILHWTTTTTLGLSGEPSSPSRLPGIASQLSPARAARRRRSLKRGPSEGGSADEDSNYWTKMMGVIRGEIQEYRSELDSLTIKRVQMERKLKQVTDEASQMSELAGAKQKGEDKVAHLLRKEAKVTKSHAHARLLAKNYKCLMLMCERHPAHSKLNFSMSTEDGASTKRHKAHAMLGQLREGGGVDGGEGGGTEGWEEAWALIRASTGIADPDLFIQKHLNCDHLETQLMELKQARMLP
ncbi:unnamed protein product [Ectocarpus sp. 8 AP-2014]